MDEAIDHDSCIQEVESLKAIFEDDLQIDNTESGRPERLTIKILPSTGDDRSKQYVCLTLILRLPPAYPHEPPEISVKNPRGLSDEEISSMLEDMRALASEKSGSPVLYEIIEIAKDCLTEGNIPHCPCAICLEHFKEGDAFTKTDCYHYFHKACLWSYYQNAQQQAEEANIEAVAHQQEPQPFKPLCPTCRFELGEVDEDDLESAPSPVEDGEMVSAITPEVRQQQAEMAEIFQKQQKQGGIIDLEAERSKYLVSADTVVVLNHDPDPKFLPSLDKKKESTKEANPPKNKVDVSSSEKISPDSQSKEDVKGSQQNRGHENKGQNVRGHDTRGQDSRSQDYRRQGYRGHDNRSHDNRRNWRRSGYSDQDYNYGDRDYYYEKDGNSSRWQDDHSRPQSRRNNNHGWRQGRDKENYQTSDHRSSEDRVTGQPRQKHNFRMRGTDGAHPKDEKENVRGGDQSKESSHPGADHCPEEKAEHGGEGGRGGGRNQRNRRNRQRHPFNRQDSDSQQERLNSGGQADSGGPENSNRNRNRPARSEQDSRSSQDMEGRSSKREESSIQSATKPAAEVCKDNTSPRNENSAAESARADGLEDKANRQGQGQRHRKRGGRRNRRLSDGEEDAVDHHADGSRDHERKPHPRAFHRRKSSEAQDIDLAQPRDRRDEGNSTRSEQEKKEGGRGHHDPRHRQGEAQHQDSYVAEAKLQARQQGTEKEDGQRYKKSRDGRGSYQGNDNYHARHRREYYGRGRGHYRHRGSRHYDDYHYFEHGPEDTERKDERGSETHDHRGQESQRDQGLDGTGSRGRGYYRRDYGRRRGDNNRKHAGDKVSPRENYTPDRGTERVEDKEGHGPKGHPKKSSGKETSESSGHIPSAPPGFSEVKPADGSLRIPPGFPPATAAAAAPAPGMRPPPGFSGKSSVTPPPGFSKTSPSSTD